MQQLLKKIKANFLWFLELQLLISLVILPILIAWGLPISIMSIIGNLLFAQFLTIFIFLSTLLFSSHFFGIPKYFITQALEWFTTIWYYFLSFGSASWLIGFASWMFPFCLFFAVIACAIYYNKNFNQNSRIFILANLLIAIFCIHYKFQPKLQQIRIFQGSQAIEIIKIGSKIYAFDFGALGARPSSTSWIEYNLTPALVKNMGATCLDTLILCKSNSRTNQAAQELMYHIPTKHLIKIQ